MSMTVSARSISLRTHLTISLEQNSNFVITMNHNTDTIFSFSSVELIMSEERGAQSKGPIPGTVVYD